MGNEIVKYDDDKYVVWNHTVDGPEFWGGYNATTKYLIDRSKLKKEFARIEATERMERARDKGSSAMWRRFKGNDSVFIYLQQGFLYLKEMAAFLNSYDKKTGFDISMLHPFED